MKNSIYSKIILCLIIFLTNSIIFSQETSDSEHKGRTISDEQARAVREAEEKNMYTSQGGAVDSAEDWVDTDDNDSSEAIDNMIDTEPGKIYGTIGDQEQINEVLNDEIKNAPPQIKKLNIRHLKGKVSRLVGDLLIPITENDTFSDGDIIVTGENSSVYLQLENTDGLIIIEPNSRIKIVEKSEFEQFFELSKKFTKTIASPKFYSSLTGSIKFILTVPAIIGVGAIEMLSPEQKKNPKSPNYKKLRGKLIAGVRGTTFRISYDPDNGVKTIKVLDGEVVAIYNEISEKVWFISNNEELIIDDNNNWQIANLTPKEVLRINNEIQLAKNIFQQSKEGTYNSSNIVQNEKNMSPIVDFQIEPVSGGEAIAPVWVKFYPSGTYDPDGRIVLFEMDMNGDGVFDVIDNTLTGGSYEFTVAGNYTATIRVTDDKGDVTTESKSFTINMPNKEYRHTKIVNKKESSSAIHEKVTENEQKDELDLLLDSTLDEIVTNENITEKPVDEPISSSPAIKKSSNETYSVTSKNKKITYNPVDENLIRNGSFEEPVVKGGYKSIQNGNNIGDWIVSKESVDLVRSYFITSDGAQSVDLHGSPGFGAIEQVITTVPSNKYEVSFDLAGNPDAAPQIKRLQVAAVGLIKEFEFDCIGKNARDMGWIRHKWNFTAKSEETTITFSTLHNKGAASAGPVIDNVTVYQISEDIPIKKPNLVEYSNESVIYPSADSYVYEYSYRNWNQANFGKSDILSLGWHSTGGEKRAYLKFDISGVKDTDFEKATLKLYHTETIGKNKLPLGVYKVVGEWQEGEGILHDGYIEEIDSTGVITWNIQPSYSDSCYTKFKVNGKKNRYLEIDITDLVKEWVREGDNNGLLIKPFGDKYHREPISIYNFYSYENSDLSKSPFIELYY